MKLLVVGDAIDTFQLNFCIYLKKNYPNITIDTLNTNASLTKKRIITSQGHVYNKIIQYYGDHNFLSNIPKVRGAIAYLNSIKSKLMLSRSNYDVIYFAGLFSNHIKIVLWSEKKSNLFRIASLYGSDFYNLLTTPEYKQFQKTIDNLDRIIISTKKMESDVLSKINIHTNKIRRCSFGLEPLEKIVELKDVTSQQAKLSLGIDEDTLVFTCGYNANAIQQHIEIVNGFCEIRDKLPVKYILLFAMTYGGKQQYKTNIKDALLVSRLKFNIFYTYMTDDEVAMLRKATDVFIQVQKNDAASGSMREHLFCRNIVITGSWLPYQDFVDNGIKFLTIPTLNELGSKIAYVLENRATIQKEIDNNNTSSKFDESRWPICIQNWYDVLNEYKNKVK